jgi:RNA polymerase sigma factor (sigma-70 family)
MTPAVARGLVRRVGPDPEPPADADLVARFARHRDPAAFADLVRRHGPMVLAACRRMLPGSADAEDAFQAVFLVLVRKAGCVRPPGAVGGWLHGVAVRTAQKARVAAARRRRREMNALASPGRQPGGGDSVAVVPGSPEHAELRTALDEELARLPDQLRAAVVLCDLGGKTRAEAAADLGCPEGTLAARLHRARRLLADRLARRGVTAPAALAATAAVPADLFASVTGFAAGGAVPRAVRALAEGVVRSMISQPLSLLLAAVAAAGLAAGAGMLWAAGAPSPDAGAASAAEETLDPAPPERTGPVYAVGYSADGSKLVSVGGAKAVVHDAATGAGRFAVDAEFAHFSGDGKTLFAFAGERFLTLDAATGKTQSAVARDRQLGGPIRWAVASADGSMRVECDGLAHAYSAYPAPGVAPPLTGQFDNDSSENKLTPRYGRTGAFRPDGGAYAGIHAADRERTQFGCVTVWKTDPAGTRVGTIARGKAFWESARSLAWAPDGKQLAVGFGDGTRVYEADTLQELRALDTGHATAVAWSPDGRVIAAAAATDELAPGAAVRVDVRLFDATSGKELRRIGGFTDNLPVVALTFRPDGKELACGAGFLPGDGPAANAPQPAKDAGGLRLIPLDAPAGARGAPVSDLSFAPDGARYVVVAGGKAVVKDAATDRVIWDAPAEAARFTADGTAVVSMGKDGARRDATAGKALKTFPRPKTDPSWHLVVFSPDGNRFAAHLGFEARLFDAATGAEPVRLEHTFGPPGGAILGPNGRGVAFSPDGTLVAAVGVMLTASDMGAAVWQVDTGKRVFATPPPGRLGEWQPVTAAAFSADGKTFAAAFGKSVRLYDTARFSEIRTLPDTPGSGPVTALAFSTDNARLAIGYRLPLLHGGDVQNPRVVGHKTEVQVLDLTTGKELRRFDGFEGVNHMGPTKLPVTALAFAPDGKTLLAGTGLSPLGEVPALPADGEVKRFNLADPPAAPASDHVSDVSFSPDGTRYVVVAYKTGVVRATDHDRVFGLATVRDATTDRVLWEAPAQAARFTADGKAVLTLGAEVARHDAATGKVLETHPRGKAEFELVFSAFSPDGRRYAGHGGFTARVFDTATATPTRLLPDRGRPAYLSEPPNRSQVLFSPDGKRVAAVGVVLDKGHLGAEVWDPATGERVPGFPPDITLTDRLVVGAAFSPDGKTLALANRHDVYLWADGGGKELRREAFLGTLGAVAYLPDGRLVVAGEGQYAAGGDKSAEETVYQRRLFVQVVDRSQPYGGLVYLDRRTARPEGAPPVTALAISPDGKTALVAAGGLTRISLTEPQPPAPAQRPAVPVWREKATLPGINGRVDSVAFSPDGKSLAVGGRGGPAQNTVTVWDTASLRPMWGGGPAPAGMTGVGFNPDGKILAATDGKSTGLYDSATGKLVPVTPPIPGGRAVAFGVLEPSPLGNVPGRRVAVADGQKVSVVSWFQGNGAVPFEFGSLKNAPQVEGERPVGLAYSPGGRRLVFIPNYKIDPARVPEEPDAPTPDPAKATHWVAQVWGGGTGESGARLVHGTAPVTAVTWSPDGKLIVTGCRKGDVVVWDAVTFKELRRTRLGGRGGEGVIHALAFAPGGRALAAAVSFDSGKNAERVVVLDPATGDRLGTDLQGFDLTPVALAFSPDGKTLAVGLADRLPRASVPPSRPAGAVKVFTTDPPPAPPAQRPAVPVWRERTPLRGTVDGPVDSVAFAPGGKAFLTGGNWFVTNTDDRGRPLGGGKEAAVAVEWRLADLGKQWLSVLGGPGPVGVAYSPDGTLVTATRPLGTGLYEVADGAPKGPVFKGGKVAAFSPDGKYLALGDGKRWAIHPAVGGNALFDLPTEPEPPGENRSAALAWSPDGTRLAVPWHAPGGKGFGFDVLTLQTRQTKTLAGHPARVTAVAWSPDGKLIATGCGKGDVIFWDAATLQELRRTRLGGRGGEGVIHALAFAPGGQAVAAAVSFDEGKNAERVVMLDPATTDRLGIDLQGFRFAPRALAFAPDGKTLVVGLGGVAGGKALGEVRVYTTDPEPAAPGDAAQPAGPGAWRPRPVATERAAVAAAAFDPQGKTFLVGGADGVVELWQVDTLTGRPGIHQLRGPVSQGALTYVPGGGTLVYCADADGIMSHDPTGRKMSHRFSDYPARMLAFPPTDTALAARAGDLGKVFGRPPVGEPLPFGTRVDFTGPGRPAPMAWAPDGKRLVYAAQLPSSGFWTLAVAGDPRPGTRLHHGPDPLGGMAWAPDGAVVVTGGWDGAVVVSDGATLKEVRRWATAGPGQKSRVRSVVMTPDGTTILAGVEARPAEQARPTAPTHAVVGWDVATGREVVRLDLPAGGPVDALILSPDGRLLVAGRNAVETPDLAPKVAPPALLVWERPAPAAPAPGAAAGPDQADGWRVKAVLTSHPDSTAAVAFAPDGKTLATAGTEDGRLVVHDAASFKTLRETTPVPKGGRFYSLAYTPDGKTLAAGFSGGSFRTLLFDPATAAQTGHVQRAGDALAYSPDGTRLAVARANGVCVVDPATGKDVALLPGPKVFFEARIKPLTKPGTDAHLLFTAGAAWGPGGKTLAVIRHEKRANGWPVTFWSPVPGRQEPPGEAAAHTDQLTAIAASPDGMTLASGDAAGDVVLWEGATWKETHRVRLVPPGTTGLSTVNALAVSPDGKTVAAALTLGSGAEPNRVVLIDTATGQVTAQLRRGWRLAVVSLAWSPDGKTLATACGHGPISRGMANPPHGAGEVVLWDRANGAAPAQPAASEPPAPTPPVPPPAAAGPVWRELGPLQGGVDGPVDSVAFAPDGKAFATAGFWYHPADRDDPTRGGAFDAAVAEWDLNRLAKRWLTRVGGPRSVGVGYSPDGKLVAATTTSGFRLFDAATGRPGEPFDGGLGMGPLALAFSGAAERVAGQPWYRVAVSNGRKTSVVLWAEGVPPSTATSGPVLGSVAPNRALPLGVAFSPDGKQVVFIPSGKTDPQWVAGKVGTPEPDPAKATHWYAQVWESEKGTVTAVLPHGESLVTAVAWSPDGRFIATGSEKGGVVVWDAKTFQRRHGIRFGGAAEPGTVHALAFAPDGKTLAAAVTLDGGKEANRVELFDPAAGTRITPGIGGFGAFTPTALAFAPDGKTLVVGCSDRSRSVFALRSEDHKTLGAVRVFTTNPR